MPVQSRRGRTQPKPDVSAGLVALCCLPIMIIAVGCLIVGVGVAFLIPALTCGAMIGMLTFVTLRENPRQ
jgi:hypothetical protein